MWEQSVWEQERRESCSQPAPASAARASGPCQMPVLQCQLALQAVVRAHSLVALANAQGLQARGKEADEACHVSAGTAGAGRGK